MSLITQCPACSTMFKVVPDQLRVSDGWVRCGQCDEVFDANAHLHPAHVAPVLLAVPISVPEPEAKPVAEYDWGPVAGVALPQEPVSQAPHGAEPDPAEDRSGTEFADSESALPSESQSAADPFLDQSPQELSGSSEWGATVEFDSFAQQPHAAEAHLPVNEPSFMVPARKTRRLGLGLSAGIVWSLTVVLGASLVMQVLVQERDHIAAAQPALKPVLEAICIPLGCQVAPFHNIEAVVIDSSSFAKASAHVYTLQFALKNAGALPVATPALELSLTDAQDKVVIRRIVQATEFAQKQTTLAAGDEVAATLPVQVKLADGADTISGYRLFAFYP